MVYVESSSVKHLGLVYGVRTKIIMGVICVVLSSVGLRSPGQELRSTATAKIITVSSEQKTSASTYTAEQEEEDSRRIRFGGREIELPERLKRDQAELKRAQARGSQAAIKSVPLFRFMLEQDKLANNIYMKLAQVWLVSGSLADKEQTAEVEKKFNDAVASCLPEENSPNRTLPALQRSCAQLHELAQKTGTIKLSTTPIPTLFDVPPSYNRSIATIAQRFIMDDEDILETNRNSSFPREVVSLLTRIDEDILVVDKGLRLIELKQRVITKHNAAHPDDLLPDTAEEFKSLLQSRNRIDQMRHDLYTKWGIL